MLTLVVYSLLFGVTMKVADLFNEHGLKEWFKGSAILFGILCGIFGGLLIWGDVYVANAIMALVLSYIVRLRVDYRNHALAAVIMIFIFLKQGEIHSPTLIFFFLNFAIWGSIKDYLDDVLKSKSIVQKVFESGWYLVLPPLAYSYFTDRWLVSTVLITFVIAYDVVKYIWEKPRGLAQSNVV